MASSLLRFRLTANHADLPTTCGYVLGLPAHIWPPHADTGDPCLCGEKDLDQDGAITLSRGQDQAVLDCGASDA